MSTLQHFLFGFISSVIDMKRPSASIWVAATASIRVFSIFSFVIEFISFMSTLQHFLFGFISSVIDMFSISAAKLAPATRK